MVKDYLIFYEMKCLLLRKEVYKGIGVNGKGEFLVLKYFFYGYGFF